MNVIRQIPAEEKWKYRELLLQADPEEQAISKYLDAGDMYVLFVDGEAVCEAVVRAEEELELMNLATREDRQGRGYASELIRWLMTRYSEKYDSMLVGTSEAGRGFYRKLGFRDAFVREQFFVKNYDEPVYENGIQCTDMYCLRAEIKGGNQG